MVREVVREVGVKDVSARLAAGENLVLLDVREPWEHELVALPGSLHIPLGELHEREGEVPAGVPVVAYCHHGVRSLTAAAILRAAGHLQPVSLAGGIDAWSRLVDARVRRY